MDSATRLAQEQPPPGEPTSAGAGNGWDRPGNGILLGSVVVGLAALVAAAAQGTPAWSSFRTGRADPYELFRNAAVLSGVRLVVAFAVTLALHHAVLARHPGAPPLRTMLQRALPVTTVMIAILTLLAIGRTELDGGAYAASGEGPVRTIRLPDGTARGSRSIDGRMSAIAGEDRTPEVAAGGGAEQERAAMDLGCSSCWAP